MLTPNSLNKDRYRFESEVATEWRNKVQLKTTMLTHNIWAKDAIQPEEVYRHSCTNYNDLLDELDNSTLRTTDHVTAYWAVRSQAAYIAMDYHAGLIAERLAESKKKGALGEYIDPNNNIQQKLIEKMLEYKAKALSLETTVNQLNRAQQERLNPRPLQRNIIRMA